MALQSEAKTIADIVKYEANPNYNREVWTVAVSQDLSMGEVVKTSSGAKVAIASDGLLADAICLEPIVTGGGATGKALFLVRGPAIVNKAQLDYGANTANKAVSDALLVTLGILPLT